MKAPSLTLKPWPEMQKAMRPLSTAEREALAANIQLYGVLQPVLVLPDGRVIDGHHRLEFGGQETPYHICDITEDQAFALGMVLNSARRQLSPEQAKEMWGRVRQMALDYRARGLTQEAIARLLGASVQSVSNWLTKNTSNSTRGNPCIDLRLKVPKRAREDIVRRVEGGAPQVQVAADYGITQQRVSQIVARAAPRRPDGGIATTAPMGIKLFHDDALQRIPLLKNRSVALVIADPPYNTSDEEWDRIGTDAEYLEWLARWLGLLHPKLKDDFHLFLFCSHLYFGRVERLLLEQGWPLKSRIIWSHRNYASWRGHRDRFANNWDGILHCGTHELNWSPHWTDERLSVQEHAQPQSNFTNDRSLHPAPKPLELVRLFVRLGSKPGDVVLDPFAGSGVTGVACSELGQRQCLLVEKHDRFCALIEAHLNIKRIRGAMQMGRDEDGG